MIWFLFILTQFQDLEPVKGPKPLNLVQEAFVTSGNLLHMVHYSKIFTWDLDTGSLAGVRELEFSGHFFSIGVHNTDVLASGWNKEAGDFFATVYGEKVVTTHGVCYSRLFSFDGILFVSSDTFNSVYLSLNPYPFSLVEAEISQGKIVRRDDGLLLGKLGEHNKSLGYNVKTTYFTKVGNVIIGVNSLEPKIITYDMKAIQQENSDGTNVKTDLAGLTLNLPDWVDPPHNGWMKEFDPTVESSKDAKGRWYCRFNMIDGLSATDEYLAVFYGASKSATYTGGECKGKKKGVAVFKHGEKTLIAHRWIGDGVLVGTYNESFVLFWPNFKDGTLTPKVELWNP